ncbi:MULTISPECIES: shikimate kinase [unclassified Pseudoclavibacter]|uniref:shikimate kinase n=1 Tax=unclassified Pseudoclavibacter TaxID=2615177 RepID=UPI000CE92373|nr:MULTISPECIES: shikimate kinase [unclassified Pseudoclavibacter]MBS3177947.1 shikimate kinase [Pseudoclavibacter sp. Marseille-Q4354]NYF13648.1 shikimate kinase [Pseudoclavibacter sp. JAI123]PPG29385.1 shikimate kinase [Pseudoclavibacter sp. RFBB5]
MSVVLIGPPAAGKSRAGRRLAKVLGASYADTDKVIVARHGAIPDIFAAHGEVEFRRLERDVIAEHLETTEVLSLGGGAVMDVETQSRLDGHTVVLLTASPAAITERITGNSKRPLITGIESWTQIYEARRETYERLADVSFDTSFRPMVRVVDDIAEWLEQNSKEGPSDVA